MYASERRLYGAGNHSPIEHSSSRRVARHGKLINPAQTGEGGEVGKHVKQTRETHA